MHCCTHMQGSLLLSTQQWPHTAEAARRSFASLALLLCCKHSCLLDSLLLSSSIQLLTHMRHVKAQARCCHMCCSQTTPISHHNRLLLLLLLYYRHIRCHTQGYKQHTLDSTHKPPLS